MTVTRVSNPQCALGSFLLSACALIALVAFVRPAELRASVITFAQFEQATGSGNSNLFAYIDNGPTGNAELVTDPLGDIGGEIPVTFTYLDLPGLPADLQGPQAAMLSLTASTTAPASTGSPFVGQDFTGVGNTIPTLTITRDTPAAEGSGSRTDLLTVEFLGFLFGFDGSTNPSLISGASEDALMGYESDFVNFVGNAVGASDMNVAFTSWTTNADSNGLEFSSVPADHYFASATAAAAGTFDVNTTAIPEPRLMGLLAAATILFAGSRRPRGSSASC